MRPLTSQVSPPNGMSREKGCLRWLGGWMKTGLKVFLTLLLGLRGLEEGSGRGTDGEGIQRGVESGVQTHTLAPRPPRFYCRPARGSRDGSGAAGWVRLLSSVGGLAAAAEPQKPQPPPPCPFRCPACLLSSFRGALLPILPLTPGLSVSVLSP